MDPIDGARRAADGGEPRARVATRATAVPAGVVAGAGGGGAGMARAASLAPLAVGLVGLVLLVLGSLAVGAVLVVLGAGATLLGWYEGSPERLLARIGGRRADATEHARLVNVADALSVALGVTRPELRVLDDAAPNALVLGASPATAVLVCTSGLVDLLDRMELEGFVAHVLAHVKRGDLTRARDATRACGVAALLTASAARWVRDLVGAQRESYADLAGAGATRYPPGLAAALEKIAAAPGTRPSSLDTVTVRLTAALWCAPLVEARTGRVVPGMLDVGERAAALREL